MVILPVVLLPQVQIRTATFDLNIEGSYTFRVTDTSTGCYVDTDPYDIAPFDLIDVVAVPTAPAICFGDANGIPGSEH